MKNNFVGLNQKQVAESREKNGSNVLKKEKRIGFWRRLLSNFKDPIIKVLLIALVLEVVVTLGRCNFYEVFGIVIAVLIATVVSTLSEMGSERAFERLEAMEGTPPIRAIRDGNMVEIDPAEIVVGDILLLSSGESVFADGVLIEGAISVDQSALNGESAEAEKCIAMDTGKWELDNPSRVYRGSTVTRGSAVMRVSRVGGETFLGSVARDVQIQTRESPLKYRLGVLANKISKIGYVMSCLVGLTYLFNTYIADLGFDFSKTLLALKDTNALIQNLIHTLTLMITVVVVAVPEGLPMMITVILSANMKKMLKSGVLVKKLVGIETAGSMNILFTDKTGTLTTGKLECESIYARGEYFRSAASLSSLGEIYKTLLIDAKYNTETEISARCVTGGNATDRAIAEFFIDEELKDVQVASKKPFSSEDKYSSVKLKSGKTIIKGAAEMILSKSRFSLGKDGVAYADALSDEKQALARATGRGERAVAVAISDGAINDSMCFVGLIFLKDKLRSGVREAVRTVKGAGIQTVMLTGDGIETAKAIAKECGIYTEGTSEIALTSGELALISDEELRALLPRLRVLARALPSDKSRLIRVSQEAGLVAGMTGDGINDAPSLKSADIGFAMGSGTDIAKGAADIVILDDSLGAIGKSVLYGRMIFKSIRKFIGFQLIMNLAACGISLIGQFIGVDNPITIIQMLWINIIMDTLGGLAFAGEPALTYYMKEKPKKRDEPILSGELIHAITVTGAYTLFILVAFLRLDKFRDMYIIDGDTSAFLTAFYALFVFSGIVNALLARSERMWVFSNIGKNKLFIVIMLFISAVQVGMIYLGGNLFRTVPLSYNEFVPVVLLSLSIIVFEFLRRIVYKLK